MFQSIFKKALVKTLRPREAKSDPKVPQGPAVCQVAGHSHPSDLPTCVPGCEWEVREKLDSGSEILSYGKSSGEESKYIRRCVMYNMNHHSHFLEEVVVHR